MRCWGTTIISAGLKAKSMPSSSTHAADVAAGRCRRAGIAGLIDRFDLEGMAARRQRLISRRGVGGKEGAAVEADAAGQIRRRRQVIRSGEGEGRAGAARNQKWWSSPSRPCCRVFEASINSPCPPCIADIVLSSDTLLAPVVKRTSRRSPEPQVRVRFPAGAVVGAKLSRCEINLHSFRPAVRHREETKPPA